MVAGNRDPLGARQLRPRRRRHHPCGRRRSAGEVVEQPVKLPLDQSRDHAHTRRCGAARTPGGALACLRRAARAACRGRARMAGRAAASGRPVRAARGQARLRRARSSSSAADARGRAPATGGRRAWWAGHQLDHRSGTADGASAAPDRALTAYGRGIASRVPGHGRRPARRRAPRQHHHRGHPPPGSPPSGRDAVARGSRLRRAPERCEVARRPRAGSRAGRCVAMSTGDITTPRPRREHVGARCAVTRVGPR